MRTLAVSILSLQFGPQGCTDKRVRNLGGTKFDSTSSLGDQKLKCAYFDPYNSNSGLQVTAPAVRSCLENNGSWSLYFKFKTDQMSDKLLPILASEDLNIISIKKDKFIINPHQYATYFTRKMEFIFDSNWHSFYINFDKYHTLQLYLDGKCMLEMPEADKFTFTNTFFIGANGSSVLNGWYIDDFNIFRGLVYTDDFISPTDYINPYDTKSNYHHLSRSDTDRLEEETKSSIEHNRENAVSYINTRQKGWLPKRCKFNWHQESHGYFSQHGWVRIRLSDKATYINIDGLDTTILTDEDKYYEGNYNVGMDSGKLIAAIILINGVFIRLSQIDIIKSDSYYCLRINDRNRFEEPPVTSVDIILLPFPIVYEEDYGERGDLVPLYAFSRDGRFDPAHGHSFYYIDNSKDTFTKHIGIRENVIPKNDTSNDYSFMNFVWRYGKLELRRYTDDGKGAYMIFESEDYSWIKPGDRFLLYNGVTLLDEDLYEVVGYDLLLFKDLARAGVMDGRTLTMQLITESNNPQRTMLFQDTTEMRVVTVEATVDNQSVFEIPEITDGNNIDYRTFMLFKGHVLLNPEGQYTIDYDLGTVTINSPKDYMSKGRHLLFVFIDVNKVDYRGPLITKPITMLAIPIGTHTATITPPNGVIATKETLIVFRNGTYVNPNRFTLDNNTIIFGDDDLPIDKCNLTCIMLRILSPYDDPDSWRESMISREYSKGNRFVLYDLGISKKIKITLDNLICFDEDGRLINDLMGYIYNLNVIKKLSTKEPMERVVRYLTCVYRTDSPEYTPNTNLPLNDTFLREYLKGRQEFYEMDRYFNNLFEEYDFDHSTDKSYGENLSNSLDYIMGYNQNRLDDVYDKRATANRLQLNPRKINSSLLPQGDGTLKWIIPRDQYDSNISRTCSLFFQDGKLADWNNNITETTNYLEIILDEELDPSSKIESINFKNMSNFLVGLNYIPQADMHSDTDINCTILTGNELVNLIPASITITEDYNTYMPATINVPFGYDFIEANNPLNDDLFSATITVRLNYSRDAFNSSIEVSEEPQGTEIDLDHFNMIREFRSTINVKSV